MLSIPSKPAVSITERAASHISKLMAQKGHLGLRIGVKKGGCAGMEYTMEYVEQADPNDETVEQNGARIIIAGFKFNNPNVSDSCGCGESINFKDIDELRANQNTN
jgi:iron-sulfur cluster assembly protein